ncbi:hypothetical protein BCT43_013885 [Vibrio lentus]|uniref:hypothetical protein n=1 Tax=Vibrio lentus TaxID=136468 RepID=UPI000C85DB06|nr:hypothetical protein [Vibrio lentus]MCC5488921.1 hypothetical protein [Vibrio lentus]
MMRSNFLVEGGEYCFEKNGFTAHFHPEFIDTLCWLTRFSKASKQTFNGHWLALREFLDYIRDINHALFEHLHIGFPLDDLGSFQQWQSALITFRDHIDKKYQSPSNKNTYLSGMHFWADLLAHKNKIARIFKLSSFSLSTSDLKPATVADALLPPHVLEAIGGTESDNLSEMSRLIANLRAVEVLGEYQLPENFSKLDLDKKADWLLTKRLSELRLGLEDRFLSARRARVEGLVAIRAHRHLCQLLDEFLNFNGGSGKVSPLLGSIRELAYHELRYGLLAWFWYRNGQTQLKEQDGKIYVRATKYLNEKRKKEGLNAEDYGWSDLWFTERLGCSPSLYSTSLLILIFDNSINVTSATSLTVDCIDDLGDRPTIEWYKRRAKSNLFKAISSKLRVSSLDVVRHLKKATKAYREYDLHPDDETMLFLSFYNSSVKKRDIGLNLPRKPDDGTFTVHTKATIADISNGNWHATAEMVRKSVLLLSAMNGGVKSLQDEAQHKKGKTSKAYADRAPMKAKHDVIMREFKEWLQTLVTLRIENAPEKLGVDPFEYKKRMEQIIDSGFGGLSCSSPMDGVQEDVEAGEICNKVGRCLTCPNKEHLFIETVDNVMHLLMWEEALEQAIEDKKIDGTDLNWHFWVKFIETILSRLTDSPVENKKALVADAKSQMSKHNNPYLLIDFKEIS